MTKEVREMLEDAAERRGAISDFPNLMAYRLLCLAGEQGAEDESILDEAMVIAKVSAGKWTISTATGGMFDGRRKQE